MSPSNKTVADKIRRYSDGILLSSAETGVGQSKICKPKIFVTHRCPFKSHLRFLWDSTSRVSSPLLFLGTHKGSLLLGVSPNPRLWLTLCMYLLQNLAYVCHWHCWTSEWYTIWIEADLYECNSASILAHNSVVRFRGHRTFLSRGTRTFLIFHSLKRQPWKVGNKESCSQTLAGNM